MFSRNGGNLGETGSVGWMFKKHGIITIEIDESAITGESSPGDPPVRRRPQRGDRRHARDLPTRIVDSRSPRSQGQSFIERMIALVEGAERQ